MNTAVRHTRVLANITAALWLAGFASLALGETAALAHFVAPMYPPLARQAMISGQVALTVSVGGDGRILDVKKQGTPDPLLLQAAEAAVRQWEFQPRPRSHPVSVTIYFGFSGTTRESSPVTTIQADFAASTVRVFVNIDGVPTVRP